MSTPIQYNNSVIVFNEFANGVFNKMLADHFSNSKKIIITDTTVCDLWIENLVTENLELSKAEVIQIPAGESSKSIEIAAQIWEALSEYEITRKDIIINFGGGMITDLGGFVASTYKRGLKFINIPTTLLSQVDASIGGKTGVNLGAHKNQIGVFADPSFVFIETKYLSTLDEEEIYSGYAEMLKHGLIADKTYWEELKAFSKQSMEQSLGFIWKSVGIKKVVVEQDHEEIGLRKILNFGHTIGHAVEGILLKRSGILHGHAVAWGMLAEARISFSLGMISVDELAEIEQMVRLNYPRLAINDGDFQEIFELIRNDKKNTSVQANFTLLEGIGKAVFDKVVDDAIIAEALQYTFDA